MGAKLRTRSHVFWSKAIWSTDISPTQRKLRKKFVDSFCVEQIILRPVKIGELSTNPYRQAVIICFLEDRHFVGIHNAWKVVDSVLAGSNKHRVKMGERSTQTGTLFLKWSCIKLHISDVFFWRKCCRQLQTMYSGGATQLGLFLFVSRHPRWPRQV